MALYLNERQQLLLSRLLNFAQANVDALNELFDDVSYSETEIGELRDFLLPPGCCAEETQ